LGVTLAPQWPCGPEDRGNPTTIIIGLLGPDDPPVWGDLTTTGFPERPSGFVVDTSWAP